MIGRTYLEWAPKSTWVTETKPSTFSMTMINLFLTTLVSGCGVHTRWAIEFSNFFLAWNWCLLSFNFNRSLLYWLWWIYSYLWWQTHFRGFKKMLTWNGSTLEHVFGCITTMTKMPFPCHLILYQQCTYSWESGTGFADVVSHIELEKLLPIFRIYPESLRKRKLYPFFHNLLYFYYNLYNTRAVCIFLIWLKNIGKRKQSARYTRRY